MKQFKLSHHHLLKPLILAVFLLFSVNAFSQQTKGTIKGKVLTADNKPAESVTILVKGTKTGTTTDEEGLFELKIAKGSYTLIVSHIGIENQEIPVEVNSGQLTQVPTISINVKVGALREISIQGSKVNKFSRKTSDDVAKMPLDNLENPQSYTTVSKELLQDQAVFTADGAVKNATGITTLWTPTGRVGDGGSYFTLRGFSVQANLRNGLAGVVTNGIDATNLEKLEVIKGPAGTLYGSSLVSFGGLINRVTKKPFEATAGEISYSAGNYNFNRASIDYNTPLDSDKRALLRINAAYGNANNFQDNGFSKNFAFDPSFSYRVNDRLSFTFDAEISHNSGTTPPIFYFNSTIAALGATNASQLSIDYKRAYQSNDLVETSDIANFYGQMNYKMSDGWRSQTNIAVTTNTSGGYGPYFYLLAGNSSIARDVWSVDGRSNNLQIQQNFIGDFKIGKSRNRIIAGVDFLSQSQSIKYTDPNHGTDSFDIINTKGPIPNYNNFGKAKVDSLFQNLPQSVSYNRSNTYTYGAYVSDLFNITDNLMAMASVRFNYFDTAPINDPTTNTTTKSYNQGSFSPKFGLVYQLIKNQVSLFGNYMNGFINPGYGLSYNAATGTNISTLFKPEQANQLEGGIKLDLFNGKLTGTFSYYDISVTNEVIGDAFHPNASIQDGTQVSKGFEAEVIANPFMGFNVIAGYSHNNSLMTKSSDYDNDRRPQTAGPPTSANLWLSYTLTEGNAKGLGLGFGGNYASDNQVINNSYNGVFTLPSYTVLNTGMFYNKSRYRLALNVNNLANKQYWIGYTTVDPQMLRQVIGSFTYKF